MVGGVHPIWPGGGARAGKREERHDGEYCGGALRVPSHPSTHPGPGKCTKRGFTVSRAARLHNPLSALCRLLNATGPFPSIPSTLTQSPPLLCCEILGAKIWRKDAGTVGNESPAVSDVEPEPQRRPRATPRNPPHGVRARACRSSPILCVAASKCRGTTRRVCCVFV